MKRTLALLLLAGFITVGVAPSFADDTKADAKPAKAEKKKADKKADKKTEKKEDKKDDAAKK